MQLKYPKPMDCVIIIGSSGSDWDSSRFSYPQLGDHDFLANHNPIAERNMKTGSFSSVLGYNSK